MWAKNIISVCKGSCRDVKVHALLVKFFDTFLAPCYRLQNYQYVVLDRDNNHLDQEGKKLKGDRGYLPGSLL